MIQAVHDSRIDPRLRHLAQTLAYFADDHGRNIFPGVRTLMTALGQEERTVRAGLQDLLATDVLVRDGYHRHTRRFRFDLERLSRYDPPPEHTRAAKREAARRRERERAAQRLETASANPGETCTTVQGSGSVSTLHSGAGNPALPCRQPCTVVPATLHSAAPDLQDQQDHHELTDVDTSAHTNDEGTDEPPFRVYAAIATAAIACARQDGDSSDGNVVEHFKRLCAEQQLPYDHSIVQKAVDAAVFADAKARMQALGAKLGPPKVASNRSTPR